MKQQTVRTLDPARPERRALQRLDVARSLAQAVNRVFLVFAITLALLWLQRVGPDWRTVSEIESARALFVEARERAESVDKVAKAELSWQNAANAATSKPVKLPGGFELEVGALYAPLVWAVVCQVLMWYLAFGRRRHFALVGRAIRELKEQAGYTAAQLTDLCPAMPWWLFPLPRVSSRITGDEFANASGWIANRGRLWRWGTSALGALVTAQLLTLYIAWGASTIVASQSKALQFGLHEIVVLLVCLTFAWIWEWYRPLAVPDSLPSEPGTAGWSRRSAFTGIGVATIALLSRPARNIAVSFAPSVKSARTGNPRFRRKKPMQVQIAMETNKDSLLNPRSRVLHYVGDPGLLPRHLASASPPALNRMTHVRFAEESIKDGVRVNRSALSWSTELAVASLLKSQEPGARTTSCALLIQAIKLNPLNPRMYDRLALLTRAAPDLIKQHADLLALVEDVLDRERSRGPGGPFVMPAQAMANQSPSYLRVWFDREVDRIVGRTPQITRRHLPRHPWRCRPTKQARTHVRKEQQSTLAMFEARKAAWTNTQSGWNKRLSRQAEWNKGWHMRAGWSLPTRATGCSQR